MNQLDTGSREVAVDTNGQTDVQAMVDQLGIEGAIEYFELDAGTAEQLRAQPAWAETIITEALSSRNPEAEDGEADDAVTEHEAAAQVFVAGQVTQRVGALSKAVRASMNGAADTPAGQALSRELTRFGSLVMLTVREDLGSAMDVAAMLDTLEQKAANVNGTAAPIAQALTAASDGLSVIRKGGKRLANHRKRGGAGTVKGVSAAFSQALSALSHE